jgi:fructokinase
VPLRIGIDLGGTKIEAIALDEGQEVARLRTETPRNDYDDTIVAIASLVDQLDPAGKAPVGIGIPGTITTSTGLVKNANSTWLIGRRLQHDLEVAVRRPVRAANDANCFAMSEAADGAAMGASVVFGVIAGTGVGGGIVVNGRIVTGVNGIAGEWGHNPLPWPDLDSPGPVPSERSESRGPVCYCGKRGCIETFLSGPGLSADHARVTGESLSPPELVEAAQRGSATAEAALRRYERRMARALASIINVLDPEIIVLGGGMSNIDRLYSSVPALWGEFVFAAGVDVVRTKLVRARHGDSSGVRGAAWLWE